MTLGATASTSPLPITSVATPAIAANSYSASGTIATLFTGDQSVPNCGIGTTYSRSHPGGDILITADFEIQGQQADALYIGSIYVAGSPVAIAAMTSKQLNSGTQHTSTASCHYLDLGVAANADIYLRAKNNSTSDGSVQVQTTITVTFFG
jgi:hypothetical protein